MNRSVLLIHFTRRELQDEVLRIRDQLDTAFLIVTHKPEGAVDLADRIVILTRRPATVRKELSISARHPRNMG